MKFSLAHDPGQAEQQTVMIGARIADRAMARLYGGRCGGGASKFEQIMDLEQVLSAKRAAAIGLIHRVVDASGR
jgi:ATP-dependent protease ClpP protease subunit